MTSGQFRIGELSQRVGVSPERLRAWERRYGLLRPSRTAGGFRLYSDEDVTRVRRMRELLDGGMAASEAARVVVAEAAAPAAERAAGLPDLSGWSTALVDALDGFEEAQAHWVLDRALAGYQLETVLREVLLPCMRGLGERWERGEVTVGQEHFASTLLRARLLALGQGWDRGQGPRALLACPPGELHDLPLVIFGVALRRYGWRITFLGADTPIEAVGPAAAALVPTVIVLAATDPQRFAAVESALAALATHWELALGGRGATRALAERIGARLLEGDPVTAAAEIGGAQ